MQGTSTAATPERRVRPGRLRTVLAAVLLAALVPALADAKPRKREAAPAPDPAAIEALTRMSDYVASLPALSFDTVAAVDIVAGNGQTVEIGMKGHYAAKRPDKLFVDLVTDVQERKLFYDGKTFTLLSPKEGYYAEAEAKPTIQETLATLAQSLAIELPLADLFDLGTPQSPVKKVRSGFLVGKATVNGVEADHWAFRSKDHDWEIWIRTGDKPLPLKVQMVNRRDPALPRYHATITWQEPASIADDAFTFTPTADQKPIGFALKADAKTEAK